MSSDGKGVQGITKRTQTDKAIYVHCECHVLNLAICGACKDSKVRDLISNINKAFIFLHFSPKRRFFEKVIPFKNPESRVTKL